MYTCELMHGSLNFREHYYNSIFDIGHLLYVVVLHNYSLEN